MFELAIVAETGAPLTLHLAAGELFVACDRYLNRRANGDFHALCTDLIALDASGAEISRRTPEAVQGVFGRWPDRLWLSARLGWQATEGPGGTLGWPVPVSAVGRWDGARFVERGDVDALGAWTDAALAMSRSMIHAWADPDQRPLPMWPSQIAGEHAFCREFNGTSYRWWHYPPGQLTAQKLLAPFAESEHLIFAVGSRSELYVAGFAGSGPFAYCHAGAGWRTLPAPDGVPTGLCVAPDGALWLLQTPLTGPPPVGGVQTGVLTRFDGQRWQLATLPSMARPSSVTLADGAVWIAADASRPQSPHWLLLRA